MRKHHFIVASALCLASFHALAQGEDAVQLAQIPIGLVTEVMELSLAPMPDISVQVTTQVGAPAYRVTWNGVPYYLEASIQTPAAGLQIQADLYFGVIRPNGKDTLTWVNDAGVPAMRTGMLPLLEGIDMGTQATLNTGEAFGHSIEHVFTGDEPPGMYLVFALLVVAGTAPANPGNWLGVDMTPLFIE